MTRTEDDNNTPTMPIMPRVSARPCRKVRGVVRQMRLIQQIAPITSLQPPYSLIRREVEDEILPFCLSEGIGVIVYSPMASGLLTGAMTREQLTNAFWYADEHRALQANNFFAVFYHRTPTAAEQQAVVNQLRAGASELTVALSFVTSAEYEATHAERVELLRKKVVIQEDEVRLAEVDVESMTVDLRAASSGTGDFSPRVPTTVMPMRTTMAVMRTARREGPGTRVPRPNPERSIFDQSMFPQSRPPSPPRPRSRIGFQGNGN